MSGVCKCHWHGCQVEVAEGERYCSGSKSSNHKTLDAAIRADIARRAAPSVALPLAPLAPPVAP